MYDLLYCTSEEIVFTRCDGKLHSLDCRTGQVKEFGILAEYYFMDSFVEIILLLDHANAVSY